ncbi:hypothetical protein ACSMFQ_06955 [Ectopseudomonas chengduensis]|jgi:hypothetical protein|nr:hypothetical protein [Pseudomonas sp.]
MNTLKKIRGKAFSAIEYIFFNRHRSMFICLIFTIASLAVEVLMKIPALFSCSGAVISIAGIFLNIKHSLHFHLKLPKRNLYYILSGAATFGGSELTKENETWVDNIISDEIYGVSFMVTGTIIWAYGSFLVNALNCI